MIHKVYYYIYYILYILSLKIKLRKMNCDSNSESSLHSYTQNESPICKTVMMASLCSNFEHNKINPLILKDKAMDSAQTQTDSSYRYNYTNNYYEETKTNNIEPQPTNKLIPLEKETPIDSKFLKQTFNLFIKYINSLNQQWEVKYSQLNKKLLNEIISLKKQKDLLVEENTKLKHKLLEVVDSIKAYCNDYSLKQAKLQSITSQLLKENKFLRDSLTQTISINNSFYFLSLFKQESTSLHSISVNSNEDNTSEKNLQTTRKEEISTATNVKRIGSHVKVKSIDYQGKSRGNLEVSSPRVKSLNHSSSGISIFTNNDENNKNITRLSKVCGLPLPSSANGLECAKTLNFSK